MWIIFLVLFCPIWPLIWQQISATNPLFEYSKLKYVWYSLSVKYLYSSLHSENKGMRWIGLVERN